MNPFAPLYAQCNTGDPAEKYKNLPEFPRLIDVELTSACNFRCLMCPTGNRSLKRKPMFMGGATFDRVVEQCSVHQTALRFIGWGEPLMHPDVGQFVIKAHTAGLLTHINTNGSKMTANLAITLVRYGLSSIKFSFQGVDAASYAAMRGIDFFDGMLNAIQMMRAARCHLKRPWIAASTSITNEVPEQVGAFCERVAPLVDELSVGKTIFDFMDLEAVQLKPVESLKGQGNVRTGHVVQAHPDPCPEVYDKLSIHANGSVHVCCNDFDGVTNLGNVNDTPIAKMWRHPVIEVYRERLARKDYDAPLCKACWDYQGLTEGAVV